MDWWLTPTWRFRQKKHKFRLVRELMIAEGFIDEDGRPTGKWSP